MDIKRCKTLINKKGSAQHTNLKRGRTWFNNSPTDILKIVKTQSTNHPLTFINDNNYYELADKFRVLTENRTFLR